MSDHEVRHDEDRTTYLTRAAVASYEWASRSEAERSGLLVNGFSSAVAAGVGVDILCHRLSDGG